MEVLEHKATFHGFVFMTKWGSLGIATVLLFFVMLFCTSVGAVSALIAAVILAAVGVFLLRGKAAPGH
jgi:hypothetical protein